MKGTSRLIRLLAAACLCLAVASCSPQTPATAPDPITVLQAIPTADAAQYERVQDMKKWRNPYLIVNGDGIVLYDSTDNMEMHTHPNDLIQALAELPASGWPYGRVVAAAENGMRASEQDGIAIRRNKGIVGGLLQGAQVAVRWVP